MVVKTVFDESTFVKTSYSGLKREVVQALVLIALVILLFLQSMRGTLIVAVAIPLSFAVTLIVLYAAGQTLNSFTLGGLTLAMGRLVDDAVVVLESIHRHQRQGMSRYRAALEGTNAVALPVLASTLTTIAVLLPVLLLAGLARKLFAPLALTVAVAMIASYFVSMFVTPVACRYLLSEKKPRGLGEDARRHDRPRRRGLRQSPSPRARDPSLDRRSVGGRSRLVLRGGDASAQHVLPGNRRVDGAGLRALLARDLARGRVAEHPGHGQDASRELPKGEVALVLTNDGSPENARSAMTSPNDGPHMGFIRVALVEPEHRKHSQRQIADMMRQLLVKHYPGVEFLQWPGGLVASVFSNGYVAPIAVEVEEDNLPLLEDQGQRDRGGRAVRRRSARHPRSAADRLPRNPCRHDPRAGGLGRGDGAAGGADHARRDARQYQHAERLDRPQPTGRPTTW